MRRVIVFLISMLAALSTPSFAQEEEKELAPGAYVIRYKDGLVTARANEASVEEMLKEFAEKSGITFNRYDGKIKKVTLDLKDADVEDFLNRVLKSYATKSKKKNGKIFVSAVTIFEESAVSEPPPKSEEASHEDTKRRIHPRRRATPRAGYGSRGSSRPNEEESFPSERRRRRPYGRRVPQSRTGSPSLPPDLQGDTERHDSSRDGEMPFDPSHEDQQPH
jgi:hypothetical protein